MQETQRTIPRLTLSVLASYVGSGGVAYTFVLVSPSGVVELTNVVHVVRLTVEIETMLGVDEAESEVTGVGVGVGVGVGMLLEGALLMWVASVYVVGTPGP
jgi:hypothetical protein